MTIAVSGANGFTGRFVCKELQRRQLLLSLCFVRAAIPIDDAHQIPVRFADLNLAEELAMQLKGCHALLNVVSIGFELPSILRLVVPRK